MTDPRQLRITGMVDRYAGDENSTGLAWARTLALSELVLDRLTGDREDAGVQILQNQLRLAAIVTFSSGGGLDVAAAHHDRLAADLDAVCPTFTPGTLRGAVLAHRLAAEICRGDFTGLRSFASHRKDGKDYTAALRLPPA
ncbi:hypothetical protein [Rhodococcus sp. X156]|uniref:hypothetical protein n=1 Tax=Rhodococcus sp. X156 TaxID=2499145 RepID=UPI000FD9A111|nr:hypothetical protein [Rhodococcus sp. X156]